VSLEVHLEKAHIVCTIALIVVAVWLSHRKVRIRNDKR